MSKIQQSPSLQDDQSFILVAIGTSAGGLGPLSDFVSMLPKKSAFAYLIAQHLSPNRPTLLPELLQKLTTLKVIQATEGTQIKRDAIYIVPQGKNIEVDKEKRIVLTPFSETDSKPSPSIDRLFTSIAHQFKEDCVGIIMSGTGHDGIHGMQEIQTYGGYTIVQDPTTAKFDGMPLSSIKDCAVNAILAPEEMSDELRLIEKYSVKELIAQHEKISKPLNYRERVLESLYKYKKVDFSAYKETTINRRIERRMMNTKSQTLQEYLVLLESNPKEVEMLYDDMLIGVTEFFRDPEAFQALSKAIEQYLEKNPDREELRVWIPGCSTGEEVYSVLITIKERLEKSNHTIRLRLFATDINEESISVARKGAYALNSLDLIDAKLIKKYFTLQDGAYVVNKSLREEVVFAFHNLLSDPPFSDLDLIACRNLLIYFKVEAQNYVMPLFHKSLRPNGLLFLGKSENSAYYDDWFIEVDAKNKLFKHIPSAQAKKAYALLKSPKKSSFKGGTVNEKSEQPLSLNEVIANESVNLFLPQLLVTNSKMEVIYKRGDFKYLSMPDGFISYNLYKMVNPNLSIEIRKAVIKAQKEQKKVSTKFVLISNEEDQPYLIKVSVTPLVFNSEEMFVFVFEQVAMSELSLLTSYSQFDESIDKQSVLSVELKNTKKNMQFLVDELESTNAQYQILNEELQSSNEEFQSTNEELETSIEELQSTNEELETAYSELKEMYAQKDIAQKALERLNYRYDSLLENINDAVVISDVDGCLMSVNHAMKLITGYTKKQLLTKKWSDLVSNFTPEEMTEHFHRVVNEGGADPYTLNLVTKNQDIRITHVQEYVTRDKDGSVKIWSFVRDMTQEYRAKQDSQLSEKKYQQTFEQANIGIAHVSLSGDWLLVNRALLEILGYSEQELMSKTFQDISHPEDLGTDLALVEQMLSGEIDEYKLEKRYFHKNGQIVWGNLSVGLVRDLEGNPLYFVSIIEDITEAKNNLLKLEQAYVVFESTQEAIIVTDSDFIIMRVNRAFGTLTGFSEHEVLGQNVNILKTNQHTNAFFHNMKKTIKASGSWSGEVINQYKNGDFYSVYLNVNAVKNADGEVLQYVGVLTDISSLKNAQEETTFLAYHDTLTGLPNRALCIERLDHALSIAKRNQTDLALFFIDLDRFKVINDGLGHTVGDKVLVEVANRLQTIFREQDTIARLGGDEFVAIVEGLDSPLSASNIANKVIQAVSQPLSIGGDFIKTGASVGISVYPNDGADFENLLRKADLAMYLAKDQGRNTFRFASEDLSNNAFEKVTLEHAIQEGLAKREFEVYYQPIVSFETQQVVSLEALIRWNHPKLGLISPNKFIPIAEESDLIVEISNFVIQEAIAAVTFLREENGFLGKVAINLSVREFENDAFVQNLKTLHQQRKISSESLQFEITERLIMPDGDNLKNRIEQIQSLGFEFIIDDFGTGYSNLKYLRSIPIKALKIDMCFVQEIGVEGGTSEEIIKATIAMANALQLGVVAEGVETQAQFDFLKQNGCSYAQGYLFSPPQSLKKICHFLKQSG
ncbi:MAG: EAL domain-containing protein [Thiotrichales bacterium]|nr:EAL domain-containing protein [Thiotrichales bacterium]